MKRPDIETIDYLKKSNELNDWKPAMDELIAYIEYLETAEGDRLGLERVVATVKKYHWSHYFTWADKITDELKYEPQIAILFQDIARALKEMEDK